LPGSINCGRRRSSFRFTRGSLTHSAGWGPPRAGCRPPSNSQDTARIGPLLSEFEDASQSTSSLGAQHAQIAAARAYNRRLYAIRSLAAQIEQERLALNDRLG